VLHDEHARLSPEPDLLRWNLPQHKQRQQQLRHMRNGLPRQLELCQRSVHLYRRVQGVRQPVRRGCGLLHEWHAEHLPERVHVLQWHVSAMLRNECDLLPSAAYLHSRDLCRRPLQYGQCHEWSANWVPSARLLQRRLLFDGAGLHRQRVLHSPNPGPDLCWQVRQHREQLRSNRQLRHVLGPNLPDRLMQWHNANLHLHPGSQRPTGPELQSALLQRQCLLHWQPGLHGKRLLPTHRHLPRGRLRPCADRLRWDNQLRQLCGTNVQVRVLRKQHLLVR